MNVLNYTYQSNSALQDFIEKNLDPQSKSILIQVFSGVLDKKVVQGVLDTLVEKLPNANIIGSSTSGEIIDGAYNEESIVLSFSTFKKTTLKNYYVPVVNFDTGISTAHKMIEKNTKAIISFCETFQSDAQNFFQGFETVNNKTIISGGNAGDNENFSETFVIHGASIHTQGIVLCALISQDLIVKNNYTLNWTSIGSELTITKASNNIVYEINDQPVLEVYKYYFGKDIEVDLPNSIVDFPLIKQENGIEIARSLLMCLEDKSFLYAGHFNVGDKVRFSIGNVNTVLENAYNFSAQVSEYSAEALFVYSCSVRRNFLKNQLNNEFRLLETIAPVSGFLTYGEFFNTGKSNQVLNITTTVLSLSEVSRKNLTHEHLDKSLLKHNPLKSLTHLVNVTQKELENKIELLEETQSQLIESEKMASLGALVAGISHEVNTPLGVGLTGISQIDYSVKELEKNFKEDTLTEESFTSFIQRMKIMSRTINNSLETAANLVKSFKNISVDQHLDETREFNLSQYIADTIFSLSTVIKKENIEVVNTSDKDIFIVSYPGAYSQIISNLILNSINHAFEGIDDKKIYIKASHTNNTLTIDYSDNGKGISKEIEKKIFDPFFTTSRGKGGSGLGMHIIYNLITQKLRGSIKILHNNKVGFHLQIRISTLENEKVS